LIDKKTVFVLGAGASCPYGYPSGARLREMICLNEGFWKSYEIYLNKHNLKEKRLEEIMEFRNVFKNANIKSIDAFMANNPKLASIGKYVIAYEVFRAERQSLFGEEAKLAQKTIEYTRDNLWPRELLSKTLFEGGDWYFYLYNRIIEGLVGPTALPDFSDGKLAFITFNYDRSLEHFLYLFLRNLFTEVLEEQIVQSLKKLKILHVYGQIAPLKWQNPNDYVDYKPQIDEPLLQRAANNVRTIYEEKDNPELIEAQNLLKQAEQVFFLGFGYAPENMKVLDLPSIIFQASWVCGTAYGWENREIDRVKKWFVAGFNEKRKEKTTWINPEMQIKIKNMDCLKLLRNHLD